jgi:hypothetical protein
MNPQTSPLKTMALVGLALLATSARAHEVVSWDNLPRAIGHGRPVFTLDFFEENSQEDRAFTVVTTNHEQVRFRSMGVDADHVWGSGHDIPAASVAEVRIRHNGAFNDPLTQSFQAGFFMCEHLGTSCEHAPILIAMIPVCLAVGVASTLPALVVEGIRRLLPARVIKVTH